MSCDNYKVQCRQTASTVSAVMQIDMLVPGLLGERDDYGQRYCGGYPVEVARGGEEWRESSNLDELNAVLQKHLMVWRLKKDVLQDLPPKLRQQIPVAVDPKHSRVKPCQIESNVPQKQRWRHVACGVPGSD